jgi:hypothetical protein
VNTGSDSALSGTLLERFGNESDNAELISAALDAELADTFIGKRPESLVRSASAPGHGHTTITAMAFGRLFISTLTPSPGIIHTLRVV